MNTHGSELQQRPRRAWGSRVAPFGALALTLTVTACDVEWGGIDVKVHEPQYARQETVLVADTATLPPLVMPTGPLVFHVRRTSPAGDADLRGVAELHEGRLEPLGPRLAERAQEYIDEFTTRYLQADQPYVLYRDGARVGTFWVRSPWVQGSGECVTLGADGRVDLHPRLDTLSEFLAWAPGSRPEAEEYRVPELRANMGELAQVLAQRGINRSRPAGGWRLRVPDDLRALNVGTGSVGFAATFMVGDTLAASPPPDSAGMAFEVADFDPSRGYFPLYFEAEWYGPGSKRALRWIDAADLVGDTTREFVVRAHGDRESWYEVIGLEDGSRAVLWSSRRPVCEAR